MPSLVDSARHCRNSITTFRSRLPVSLSNLNEAELACSLNILKVPEFANTACIVVMIESDQPARPPSRLCEAISVLVVISMHGLPSTVLYFLYCTGASEN